MLTLCLYSQIFYMLLYIYFLTDIGINWNDTCMIPMQRRHAQKKDATPYVILL